MNFEWARGNVTVGYIAYGPRIATCIVYASELYSDS